MKINITHNNTIAKTIIFPLLDNEYLAENLSKIAKHVGLNAEHLQQDFKAGLKESLILYGNQEGLEKVYLLGLGKSPKQIDFVKAFRSFFYNSKKKLPKNVGLKLKMAGLEAYTEFIVNGICLADYEVGVYKTEQKKVADFFSEEAVLEIQVTESTIETVEKSAKIGHEMAETQARIMALVDAPANFKYPQKIAEFAIESGEKYGFDVKVFDEKQCLELGLHALLAVGRGSTENPARFIVMEYNASQENVKKIGLVGKGVTFDTGGISIKGSASMSYMKSDMGGAGAVLGTLEMVAKLKLPVHLIGVIPCTENCVDGNALKPSEVISSYSGKTIEVIDTDAEGRLVLADGLSYIKKNFEPDVIIDLATLTGNCISALGYVAAGLLSNNDILANKLLEISQLTGEKLWRLPLWDDYKDMMNSDIADIKNLSSAPLAGAITAAKFLEVFIDGHTNWAHLDIAGLAFGDSEFAKMKSGTAYGVNLLTTWLREIN
ncbi:Cytosol aminopeptidase [Emticicia aquatica]|uniref:Probable cytosol aminopeptidase n=1 Tax=Emticicia aquatica TaxID=1681835 RepID=A0ABM9AT20_9BACT|nr:leucyl aminopeptidase family protein [Emticicia aquatica]CAH0997134.1 Cytosol aminopeptidase [Emticicia aquatica]